MTDIVSRLRESADGWDECGDHDNAAFEREAADHIEFLTKLLTTRFARSSPIEEKLLGIATGKLPLPTRERCGEWAVKLGIPQEYHELLKEST